MLNDHLQSPVTRSRLRAGLVAPHIDDFADWLNSQGYTPLCMQFRLRELATVDDWLRDAGYSAGGFCEGVEAYRLALQRDGRLRYSSGNLHNTLSAAALFVRFLQEQGVLTKPPAPTSPLDTWPLLGEFRSWMARNRGLAQTTMDLYQFVIVDLFSSLGDDPSEYCAKDLRTFVLRRARPHGISRAKTITIAVRAFLRFLAATGRAPVGMEYAIPSFPSRELASTPRFLEPDDVERVIAACSGERVNSIRDRAVVLLLARLGLRASDVVQLTFDDIDWPNGRIAVCGKGRRQEWLPLPQEVGDAIARYLCEGRPELRIEAVFTTVRVPYRAVTRMAVSCIVRRAIGRAGIKAPSHGAHVLRHSAATAMLRKGATLSGVSAVLRHRSLQTTMHYAKVDFGLLSEITQPWPGVAPC